MDNYGIDSHKLMFHVDRVADWLGGASVCPIYVEISLSGACNHRCIYCALDFMGYRSVFLDTAMLKKRLKEMAAAGVRSVMFGGEGEPLMHKDAAEIVAAARASGLDVAITTNGVFLNESMARKILPYVSWIKVSINAARRETYAKIHRTTPLDFDRVLKNLSESAALRKARGYRCVLGMQLLLLPENRREVVPLARLAREIGADYLVVKPYSQHPLSCTRKYSRIRYERYRSLAEGLSRLDTPKFKTIFRSNTMRKWDEARRPYDRCYALPFWSYIDARGNFWGCSSFLTDPRFNFGNIGKKTIRQILAGPKRRSTIRMMARRFDIRHCRKNCRMDEINRYLWEIKHPHPHVNFI